MIYSYTEQFAKYLPLTGGTLTGNIAAKGGTTVHYAAANAGSAGFLKIAQFKITGSYQNKYCFYSSAWN